VKKVTQEYFLLKKKRKKTNKIRVVRKIVGGPRGVVCGVYRKKRSPLLEDEYRPKKVEWVFRGSTG